MAAPSFSPRCETQLECAQWTEVNTFVISTTSLHIEAMSVEASSRVANIEARLDQWDLGGGPVASFMFSPAGYFFMGCILAIVFIKGMSDKI